MSILEGITNNYYTSLAVNAFLAMVDFSGLLNYEIVLCSNSHLIDSILVNVNISSIHRIIARNTLFSKFMGLQLFKWFLTS